MGQRMMRGRLSWGRLAVVTLVGGLVGGFFLAGDPAWVRSAERPAAALRATPNEWTFSRDGLAGFPLLDFTRPEQPAPKPDPKVEAEAQKLYAQARALAKEKKWTEARQVIDQMLKQYEKHPRTADALNYYADRMSRDKEKRDATLATCRELMKRFPHYSWAARRAIERATQTRLYVGAHTASVGPGEKPQLHLNGRNVAEVRFTVYQVDLFEMLKEGISPGTPQAPKDAKPLKTWTHTVKKRNRRQWFSERVELPVTEPGAYLVIAGTEHYSSTTMAFISRLALVTKADGRILLAYASTRRGGQAPGVCEIAMSDQARLIYRGRTNPDGLFVGRVKGPNPRGIVVVRQGEHWAVSYAAYHAGARRRGRVFGYADRPVYRPNQTVHLKLVLRRYDLDQGAYRFEPGEELEVRIRDPRRNEVLKKKVKVNEFGTATLSMTLGDEPPLGSYYVNVRGPGAYGNFQFSVAEYKKPEYEVKVAFDRKHAVVGDPVKVEVTGRYYFGEPVTDAEVKYEIRAIPRYDYSPYWRRRHPHWWFLGEDHPALYSGSSLVPHPRGVSGTLLDQGQGRIDETGKFEIAFDTGKLQDLMRQHRRNYVLSVRASVTDKSRRQIQGYGQLVIGRSRRQVSLYTGRYSYRPGDKVTVRVHASDLAGEPVAADVRMHVRRRIEGGKYAARLTRTVKTDEQGDGALSFVPDDSGRFQVQATVKDAAGREFTTSISLWVADRAWRSRYRYRGIEIKTDQPMYQPGDTAQVLITSGHVDHPALVTIEGEHLESYRLQRFNGSLLTFDQPVEKSFSPNVNVTAMVFADGAYVSRSQKLVVPPADKWLDVKITTDRPEYKPGDPATYTVLLTDHQGKPVSAELSFGLVDEAIYAVRKDSTPDIRKFFYGHRRRYVRTQTSFWFRAVGFGQGGQALQTAQGNNAPTAQAEEAVTNGVEAAAPGLLRARSVAKGGAERGLVEPRLRKEFADSAVWRPTVRTDADGQATITFQMPDNLTTWRAKVIALTATGLVGQETHKVITRQNLMVRLECPRTFTERDEVTVSAVVHNYLTDDKRGVVRLKHDGGERVRGPDEMAVDLPRATDQRVDWRLKVSTHRPIKLTVEGLTDEESDAMQLIIPVLPHGLKLIVAESGRVEKFRRVGLMLPDEADERKSRLRVSLAPSLAATMLDSLEYLAGYPYGCVEQTMSRFLPSVMVARVLQKLDRRNAKLEENLPKYVAQGLQKLYGYQKGDGGWGWWKRDKSNPYMSAYVVYGLAMAREADFAVSDRALNRGTRFLARALPEVEEPDVRAYMLYAYAQLKPPKAEWVDDLYGKREKLNDYATALLTLTCHKLGQADRVDLLLDSLEKRAIVTPTACSWGGKQARRHWRHNSIQSTAYALKAIVAVNPKHPLLAKVANWLVVKRTGRYWRSTKDTAAAIFALVDYMQATGELNPDYQVAVAVNGRRIKAFRVAGDALKLEPVVIELGSPSLRLGENVIEITRQGEAGNLYYSCVLEYFTKGEDLKPTAVGLSVQRDYFKLVPKRKGNEIVFDRRPLGREVKGGEEIEVRITVNADKNYQYFILEDYFPAGCEIVEDKSNLVGYRHWWSYCANREARDEKMVFFSTYLSAGKHTFNYILRAETPGEFHVMPARASLMYEPDVRGTSAENRLSIFEK